MSSKCFNDFAVNHGFITAKRQAIILIINILTFFIYFRRWKELVSECFHFKYCKRDAGISLVENLKCHALGWPFSYSIVFLFVFCWLWIYRWTHKNERFLRFLWVVWVCSHIRGEFASTRWEFGLNPWFASVMLHLAIKLTRSTWFSLVVTVWQINI
jgi:hypothetical protein